MNSDGHHPGYWLGIWDIRCLETKGFLGHGLANQLNGSYSDLNQNHTTIFQ